MTPRTDVIVLGAGIVGVSSALHLQARGRAVVLLDRHPQAGRETSYGNAGLIERASISPYMFPRDLGTILKYAFNTSPDVQYHLNALPKVLPWLARYFLASSKAGTARSARAALPLITLCLAEHEALIAQAGVPQLLRKTGWIKLYRTQKALDAAHADIAKLAPLGLSATLLDRGGLAEIEPHLTGGIGAVHYRDPGFVPDPGGLAQAYANLFVRRGGIFVTGDALSLSQAGAGWQVTTAGGVVAAREVVVALGPWANHLLAPLGYRIPLEIKRGYHMHYGAQGNAVLQHSVLDDEGGYLLGPMNQGIRMTTGAEFARFDAPPSPAQIDMCEPLARKLFPLAQRLDAQPWMGRRPCLPDMLPVIGPAPRHTGLWLNFGHQHHGLTLGPVCGRLLAEMMTGQETLTDPGPYRVTRFGV